jgi:hypothetical protein
MSRASRFIIRGIGVQVEEDMVEEDVDQVQAEEDMVEEDMVGQDVDKAEGMAAVGQADMLGAEVMAIQMVEGEAINRDREVSTKEDVAMVDMEEQTRGVGRSCRSTQ